MNIAAQQLAKMRWDNATAQEIAENSQRLIIGRRKKLSKKVRSDIARMGGIAKAIKAGQRMGQQKRKAY